MPPEPVGVAESSANVALKRRSDGQSLPKTNEEENKREREGVWSWTDDIYFA